MLYNKQNKFDGLKMTNLVILKNPKNAIENFLTKKKFCATQEMKVEMVLDEEGGLPETMVVVVPVTVGEAITLSLTKKVGVDYWIRLRSGDWIRLKSGDWISLRSDLIRL